MARKNVLLDDAILEMAEKMESKMGYDFLISILRYGIRGTAPTFDDKMLDMLFIPIRKKIDYYQERYDRCVENGKKGAEFGMKGGRPRKGETRDEYLERKEIKTPRETPTETPRNNEEKLEENEQKKTQEKPQRKPQEKPQRKPQEKPLNDNVNVNDNININKNINNKKLLNNKEEINSININNQLLKEEDFEMVFRNKLKEEDNRKWVTENATYEIALNRFPKFRLWVIEKGYDELQVKRVWDKMRISFLSKREQAPKSEEVPTEKKEKKETPKEIEIDVSTGTNKEIYDYLLDKKRQGLFRGSYAVAKMHNMQGLSNWRYEHGYDDAVVGQIFDMIDRRLAAAKEQN